MLEVWKRGFSVNLFWKSLLMRYSKLFGKTVKTAPKDAITANQKFLVQGGFVRALAAGRYTFLPLGMRVNKKVEKIIREEVEKTGAQEVVIPTLHPIELWKKTHRDEKFGTALMHVADRRGSEFALGATGEAVMLDLVNQFSPSYKDLPINIFQFSQKFRDEARAKGGLLRVREFVMKDGYSFHTDEKEFESTYKAYWEAYLRIAKRLDLKVEVVESDSGALGGDVSHEFMVETEVGEDIVMKCDECGYSANLEKSVVYKDSKNVDTECLPLEEVEAIRGNTMEDGVALHNKPLWLQIKDVVYVDDKGRYILVIIRGDYSVNETKLMHLVNANELAHASDQDIRDNLHSEPGFISPVGIKDNLSPDVNLVIVADDSLRTVRNAYGGSNRKNVDLFNVNIDRDYTPDFEGDVAEAPDDSVCGKCEIGRLHSIKCVEFGNIFNLGTTYSDLLDGDYIDETGKSRKIWMGSYGIGLGRAIGTIVETHHDEKGIIWPKSVAPFQVHILNLSPDESVVARAEDLYQKLLENNIDVLWDDRADVSAGVKFADADLIGIPLQVVIGKKNLAGDKYECKYRSGNVKADLNLDEIIAYTKA